MLNQNLTVVFKYGYGASSLTLKCRAVRYGIELVGQVEDDIDFELVETYHIVRQLIGIKLLLQFSEAVVIADFLASTSKSLVIDGTEVEVVNDGGKIDFGLFEDTSVRAEVDLKFKKRDKGLINIVSSDTIGYIGNKAIISVR